MKATGIVRRIDDLGRIVIPKEIRRTLRIRETDPLEIFTNREGEIILKKYSSIGELGEFSKTYAECMAQTTGNMVCVSDRDQIVAAAGTDKKNFLSRAVSWELETVMDDRSSVLAMNGEREYIKITADGEENYAMQIISPIICEGDVCGSVIMLSRDEKNRFGEAEKQMVDTAANFLGKQLES